MLVHLSIMVLEHSIMVIQVVDQSLVLVLKLSNLFLKSPVLLLKPGDLPGLLPKLVFEPLISITLILELGSLISQLLVRRVSLLP